MAMKAQRIRIEKNYDRLRTAISKLQIHAHTLKSFVNIALDYYCALMSGQHNV